MFIGLGGGVIVVEGYFFFFILLSKFDNFEFLRVDFSFF